MSIISDSTNKIDSAAPWELTTPSKNDGKNHRYTGDDLIDAYLQGKKEQKSAHERILLNTLKDNFKLTNDLTSELFKYLSEYNYKPVQTYLKVASLESFKMMLVLPEEEYLREGIYDLFAFISDLEQKYESDIYNIFITICNYSGKLNEKVISSDGYYLKYIA